MTPPPLDGDDTFAGLSLPVRGCSVHYIPIPVFVFKPPTLSALTAKTRSHPTNATMATKLPMLVVVVATLLMKRGDVGEVTLYNHPEGDELLNTETLDIGPAQRCHSFTRFGHGVTQAKWSDLQENAMIVFYNEFGYKGKYVTAFAGDDYEMSFYGAELVWNISSLMLWESAMYPTRGIVDKTRGAAWTAYYYDYESCNTGESRPNSENGTGAVVGEEGERVAGMIHS